MCIPARVLMLWLRRRRLPEQVDRAGSIALVPQSRKLEEGRDLHINTSNREARGLPNKPIVTDGARDTSTGTHTAVFTYCVRFCLSPMVAREKGRFQPCGCWSSKPVGGGTNQKQCEALDASTMYRFLPASPRHLNPPHMCHTGNARGNLV